GATYVAGFPEPENVPQVAVQFTDGSVVPRTVAVNSWLAPVASAVLNGLTWTATEGPHATTPATMAHAHIDLDL
ncbi:MAG: hypothetical protein R6W77_16735, partial [Trueperaceae bacterium]